MEAELGLGAGGFHDAIAAMGGPRLTPGQGVDALEEAIDVIRELWDVERPGGARYEGKHYRLAGSRRGPAPLHDVSIWVGAYKPRMLDLTGRKADGWLPSLPYLEPGQLAASNDAIDRAAAKSGRKPSQIRRLLNITGTVSVEELTRLALEDGIGTFILTADDSEKIRAYAEEVAPRVREEVAAGRPRAGGMHSSGVPSDPPATVLGATGDESEYDRLGVTPTPNDGVRFSARVPWEESTRPHRPSSGPDVEYSDRGRLVGKHLVDVHDALRSELAQLREILAQVRDGAIRASEARSALNEMALRQNDWTLGAFCSRYCGALVHTTAWKMALSSPISRTRMKVFRRSSNG